MLKWLRRNEDKKQDTDPPPPRNNSSTETLRPEVTFDFSHTTMQIETASSTHIGTREYQQDAIYVSEGTAEPVFGILCDGMGGMEDGEKASASVLEFMANQIAGLSEGQNVPAFFQQAIQEANYKLLEEYHGTGAGTGTTFVSVIIQGNHMHWASVGDSRIYIIRGNEIVQMTRDHNYGMELDALVEKGRISRQEAEEHPQREMLISYLGAPQLELVDVSCSALPLQHGDTVLLCSDGLTKSLSNEEILGHIIQANSLHEAAALLPIAAFDAGEGGQDNTSVILLRYYGQ